MMVTFNFQDKWILDFSKTRLLMKVGKRDRLEELRQGKIYMKPVKFHRDNEKNFPGLGIGDGNEGIMTKFNHAQILINGKVIADEVDGIISANDSNPVFCCMAIDFKNVSDKRAEFRVDERMIKDFVHGNPDEYGVLLIDQTSFLERIDKVCKQQHIRCIYRNVIYSDDMIARIKVKDGILASPAFFKGAKFSYQNEFRILFATHVKDHFILDIGDISDITRSCSVNLLKCGIDLIKDE